ncbi:unnamed protein product [Brassicogethes aeneus]|uniref:ENT domain-containing protein n=1 Tax=Brassicogethes aeneus TaxID=1431903 RepID=A0A9P0B741_BRAAE|nr:unnamed protein product [Brassicogethes aeneus]
MPIIMWPSLVDMSKEESFQYLRHLELEAYSHLVSALRAQGSLNAEKKKLLKESSLLLNITQERHNAEIRRAISDEKLNTVAYHINGQGESLDDWAQEGRRLIPMLPRMAPQTAYTSIADEVADNAAQNNKQLPSPSATERKRTINIATSSVLPEGSSKTSFRIPEPPKFDEAKKRKLSISENSSCLAQHLLGPSKTSRIQQLYRQRTKIKSKEQYQYKLKDQQEQQQQQAPSIKQQYSNPSSSHPKINVLQNISLQPPTLASDESGEQSDAPKQNELIQATVSNENQAPRNKILTNLKAGNVTLKQITCPMPGSSNEAVPKSVKMCPAKKAISKTMSGGQKLIVVSNAQTIPSSSILQRTLSIPFVKNISVKNFEKFKIVTSTSSNAAQVSTANSNTTNSVKHKVVTVRTNSSTSKKVIPLSQLQVLNSKGNIKVLPLGGKIVGKSVTSTTSSPLYIMNTMGNVQTIAKSLTMPTMITTKSKEAPNTSVSFVETSEKLLNNSEEEKTIIEEIVKVPVVIKEETEQEDYDSKIEEFHITQTVVKEENNLDKTEFVTEDVVKDEIVKDKVTNGETEDLEIKSVVNEGDISKDPFVFKTKECANMEVEEFDAKFDGIDNGSIVIKK